MRFARAAAGGVDVRLKKLVGPMDRGRNSLVEAKDQIAKGSMTPQVNADSNYGGANQRRTHIKQIDPNKLGMGKSMFSMAGLRAGDNLLQKA